MAKLAQPFVYRISTADEWEELQRTGATLGGELDRSTRCIHLSDLSQVSPTFDPLDFVQERALEISRLLGAY